MRVWAIAAAVALLGCGDTLHIGFEDGGGVVVVSFVALTADTAAERAAGLRDLPPLGEAEALWLRFPVTDEICIVNAGVPYAIDIVHIDEDDEVIAIARDVPAGDTTPRCVAGTRSVVETRAGATVAVRPGHLLKDDG